MHTIFQVLLQFKILQQQRKITCILTCFPSIAPKQFGNCQILSKSSIIFNHLFWLLGKTKISGCNVVQRLLNVSGTNFFIVAIPIRNCFESDAKDSPVARYLKYYLQSAKFITLRACDF